MYVLMCLIQIPALVLALIRSMRDPDLPATPLAARVTEIMTRMKMVESQVIKSCLEMTVKMSMEANTAVANQNDPATNQMRVCTQTTNTAGQRAIMRRMLMTMRGATYQMWGVQPQEQEATGLTEEVEVQGQRRAAHAQKQEVGIQIPALLIQIPALLIQIPAHLIQIPALLIQIPALLIQIPAHLIQIPAHLIQTERGQGKMSILEMRGGVEKVTNQRMRTNSKTQTMRGIILTMNGRDTNQVRYIGMIYTHRYKEQD